MEFKRSVLMDFVLNEDNTSLFLNTNVDKVELKTKNMIQYVSGSQLGSEKRFVFYGRYFFG